VAVAYADWRRAGSPVPAEVWSFARDNGWDVFLLDTWAKDGSTLLDWVSLAELIRLRERSAAAGVRVALAGSLGPRQLRALRPAAPDWFAVRGAVCRGGRDGEVNPDAVRELIHLIHHSDPSAQN
jgi:uncharacterized protein (UPF0264 family)